MNNMKYVPYLEDEYRREDELLKRRQQESFLNQSADTLSRIGGKIGSAVAPMINKVSQFNDELEALAELSSNSKKYGGINEQGQTPLDRYKAGNPEQKQEIRGQIKESQIENSPFLKALNSEKGRKIIVTTKYTRNLGVKGISKLQAIGDNTYENALKKWEESSKNPDNPTWKRWLYQLQDSVPQSGIGILLALGASALTKNPTVGKAVAGTYFGAIAAQGQIEEKGRVESVGNLVIEPAGDVFLAGIAESVLKASVKKGIKSTLTNIGKGFITEGGTEVTQAFGTMVNDYDNAISDEERQVAVDKLKDYVKSGAMVDEFMVGGLSGGIWTGVAGAFSPKMSDLEVKGKNKELAKIYKTSIATQDLQYMGEARNDLGKNAGERLIKDGKLKDTIVKARVSDVVQKLESAKIDPTDYKNAIEGKTYKDYAEFDKANREIFSKMMSTETAVTETLDNPNPEKRKLEEEPQQTFNEIIKALPREKLDSLVQFLSKEVPVENIEKLTKEDKQIMVTALTYAKQVPGVDVATIEKNIGLLEEGFTLKEMTKEEAVGKETGKEFFEKPTKGVVESKPKAIVAKVEQKVEPETEKDPLVQEARKYKSAEEFVKAQHETTYRGASKAEWEAVQQTGKFEKPSGKRLIDKRTGKEIRTAGDEAINTSPDKRVADLYGAGSSKEGVVIEFKPEAKGKMKFSAKFDATDLKADEYLGEGLTLDDVAKVTDKNGKVIYEATTGGKTKSQLIDIWNKSQPLQEGVKKADKKVLKLKYPKAKADLKEGKGKLPKVMYDLSDNNLVDKLLDDQEIMDEIKKIKEDVNPEIARRLIFSVVDSLNGVAGVFKGDTGVIEIAKDIVKEKMKEAVAHEPGHFAWMMMDEIDKAKAIEEYQSKTVEEKRAVFGKTSKGVDKFYWYINQYNGSIEDLAEEYWVTWAAKDYLLRKAGKIKTPASVELTRFQHLIKKIADIFDLVASKIFKNHKPMEAKELFRAIYNRDTNYFKDKNISFRRGKHYMIEDLVTDKGSLRVQEVFKSSYKKLYGEEASAEIFKIFTHNARQVFEKGVQVSYVAGKGFQRKKDAKVRQELRAKNIQKMRDLRKDLNKAYKEKTGKTREIKGKAVDYIKASLPIGRRGDLLVAVRDATTPEHLKKVIIKVDEKRASYERNLLVKSIKKITKFMHRLPIDIQRDILAITSNIDLKNRTKKLLKRAAINKEMYLKARESGFKTSEKVLEEVGLLEKTPLKDLTNQQLIDINTKLQQLSIIGKSMLRRGEEIRQKSKEEKLELLKSSANLDRLTDEEIGNVLYKRNLNLKGKALLKYKAFREWLKNADITMMGTDRVIRILDNNNQNWTGPNATLIMHPIDDAVSSATSKIDDWKDKFNRVLEPFMSFKEREEGATIIDKAKSRIAAYKKQQIAGQNIAIVAFSKQEGGKDKLIEAGTASLKDMETIEKEIDADTNQRILYKYMRNQLDDVFPKLKEAYELLHPTETINFVKNFFPMRTDYNIATPKDENADYGPGINFGSLKHREKDARQILRTNAIVDFQNYMEKAIYYIEVAKTLRDVKDVVETKEYKEIVGRRASAFMSKWIKIVAKQGGNLVPPRPFERTMDFLRTNVATSTLGLRPSTVIRQQTAMVNGAAAIGAEYQGKGMMMFVEKQWRDFIKKASPQMVNRLGGDVLWQDLSEKALFKKLQEMTMSGTRFSDYGAAGTTWIGAYQKRMDELGKAINANEVNLDARRYADLMVRLAHGTAQFHKAPQILFNENRTWWRAFYMFETFNLSNWAQFSKDIPAEWKVDKVAAAKKGAFLMMQIGLSGSITYLNGALMASLLDDDDDDKNLKDAIINEACQAVPFLNKITSIWNYQETPIVLVKYFGDLTHSLVYSLKATKQTTRTKNQIKTVSAILGMLTGLPPKFITETLIKSVDSPTSSGF
jgi:hypothetical protein